MLKVGDAIEAAVTRKVALRIVPLLFVCYLVNYLDRVNVGFAALTMNQDLGFSAQVFGFGSGALFLTYFVVEVPSTIMLHRLGARRWLARIMFSWGVISGSTAFIPQIAAATGISREVTFYIIRLLLGAAEAGFIPGVLFYLSIWCPASSRARIVGYFMTALPLAGVVGAPLSGMLLSLSGPGGLTGWQMLFLIEAAPALVLAVVLLLFLTDRPEQANWLDASHREWLVERLSEERRLNSPASSASVLATVLNPTVLICGGIYFGVVAMNYSLGFFLPSIIRDFGLSNLQTGFAAAIPAAVGAISMVLWGRRSDRLGERKWHLVFALAVGAGSFAAAALAHDPFLKMGCFALAACGIYGCQPVFWTLPSAFLSDQPAAAGIATINSIANVSGFVGPFAMGWIKTSTGDYADGLLLVAVIAGFATVAVLGLGRRCFPTARVAVPLDGLSGLGN